MAAPFHTSKSPSGPRSHKLDPSSIYQFVEDLIGASRPPILGLRLVGRRAFGELGPQDVVLLLLLAEGLNAALVPAVAGFWGSLASALVLLVNVGLVERVGPLRKVLDGSPVDIVIDGQMLRGAMRRYQVDESDIQKAARQYGVAGPEAFERAVLEGDGSITAVLKPEHGRLHRVAPRPL